MAFAIDNEERGCGQKRDGWYMEGGPMSPDGHLVPLVWCHGAMTLDTPENLLWNVPARAFPAMDSEQSLDTCSLIEEGVGLLTRASGQYTGSGRPQLARLEHSPGRPLGLLHHVGHPQRKGRRGYTPASKAIELVTRGPSERMHGDMVCSLAQLLQVAPIRIFYSHAHVPHLEDIGARNVLADYLFSEDRDDEWERYKNFWMIDYEETAWEGATWDEADWRWTMVSLRGQMLFPNNGRHHWWVKALSYLSRHEEPFPGVREYEAVYCGSWVTSALRVISYETAMEATGKADVNPDSLDDTQFVDASGLRNGVKVAILPPEGTTTWR